MDETNRDSLSSLSGQTQSFQVCIRLRPNGGELQPFLRCHENRLYVQTNSHERRERKYEFNRVFHEDRSNLDVFESVKEQVGDCLSGYNLTLLAYGVTGSGKTHTIFGTQEDEGLAMRCCRRVFQCEPTEVKFSYMEVYNENVRDLLSESNKSLSVLEDGNKTVIPQLGEFEVKHPDEVISLIQQGNGRRVQGSTNINEASSRSHAILQFLICIHKDKQVIQAKLTVIDLAGSERMFHNESDKMMLEGSNINKSLLALGNCITALADRKGTHVPFRDSKLTRILKEGLSGNSRSVMVACLSSNQDQYEQTLSTIYYASRATKIRKQLSKNIKQVGVECPNCHHTFDLPGKLSSAKSRDSRDALQQMATVDFIQLKEKMSSLIEQSMLIGKRNSSQESPFDISILKDVFESNRGAVYSQIDKLSAIQKSVSTKLLITDGSSAGLRTKSSNHKPLELEQTTLRRDPNRTTDDLLFKENKDFLFDQKGDTFRRCTFDPHPRSKRNRGHNQSQLISRRTSRQHSNISELSEVDNTPTLRMKRDSLQQGVSPDFSIDLQPFPKTNNYRSARLSLKPTGSKKLKLL